MDKQQAAEEHIKDLDVSNKQFAYNDFILGWEAHEAQCPGEAVIHAIAFGEWIAENAKKFVMTMGEEHKRIFQMSIADKYKLFNPSGAAPQVFTREQVSEAFHAGVISGLDSAQDRPFITQDEYMDTNYPAK